MIFDSNCHPTVNSTWLNKNNQNSFENLSLHLKSNRLIGALAVGLEGMDSFEPVSFIRNCNEYKNIIPIAGFNPHYGNILERLNDLHNLGYLGIKIHPRFSNFDLELGKDLLIETINSCEKIGLAVLLCTYFLNRKKKLIIENPIQYLNEVFSETNEPKIMLMHSGYLLYDDFLQKINYKKNILFDFSYTIMASELIENKKPKKAFFQKYYDKICLGSDWPEYQHDTFLERVKIITNEMEDRIAVKIMSENVKNFFGI